MCETTRFISESQHEKLSIFTRDMCEFSRGKEALPEGVLLELSTEGHAG